LSAAATTALRRRHLAYAHILRCIITRIVPTHHDVSITKTTLLRFVYYNAHGSVAGVIQGSDVSPEDAVSLLVRCRLLLARGGDGGSRDGGATYWFAIPHAGPLAIDA
jgi:hypothetical protein